MRDNHLFLRYISSRLPVEPSRDPHQASVPGTVDRALIHMQRIVGRLTPYLIQNSIK